MDPKKLHKFIDNLKEQIAHKWTELQTRSLKSFEKEDQTPVTELDLFISSLVKEALKETPYHLLSEEEPERDMYFPLVVLDPVDGTKELVKGVPEWTLSCAFLHSKKMADSYNQAFVFNPLTGFLKTMREGLITSQKNYYKDHPFTILVSRNEWDRGEFGPIIEKQDKNSLYQFLPRGSIANKLALMAAGAADGVVCLQDRYLWDIAAGTLLAHEMGFSFYEDGQEVFDLDKLVFKGPLIWCRKENKGDIEKIISKK